MACELLQIGHSNCRMPNPHKSKILRSAQKQRPPRRDQRCNRTIPKTHIRVALFMALSLCLLSGCQKPQQQYGNFVGADSAELVLDAANAMYAAYPPAKTRLVLLQPAEDALGLGLLDSLRSAGYAVAEYAPPEKGGKSVVGADAGLGFAYTIENLSDGDGLRLTLHVGDGTLGRMYRMRQSDGAPQYIPQGFWTRKQ